MENIDKQKIYSYKDLLVWQKAKQLSISIYKLTGTFPSSENFGITSQMRRSAISIPSNIAEGRNRGTKKDFLQFSRIAYGSASELETQVIISKELSMGDQRLYNEVENLIIEVSKMLRSIIYKFQQAKQS